MPFYINEKNYNMTGSVYWTILTSQALYLNNCSFLHHNRETIVTTFFSFEVLELKKICLWHTDVGAKIRVQLCLTLNSALFSIINRLLPTNSLGCLWRIIFKETLVMMIFFVFWLLIPLSFFHFLNRAFILFLPFLDCLGKSLRLVLSQLWLSWQILWDICVSLGEYTCSVSFSSLLVVEANDENGSTGNF